MSLAMNRRQFVAAGAAAAAVAALGASAAVADEAAVAGSHDVIVLGAGGAGTAVLVQAALDGMAAIDVFNPRDAFWPRAERVAAELERASQCRVVLHDLDDREALRTCLGQADLLVNTTPVGMERMPGCLIPDASWLHAGLTVSDVIYQPRETQLLRMAREAGLKTFNGMYMLLHQGAASFRLWTGREMPIQQIREKYFQ